MPSIWINQINWIPSYDFFISKIFFAFCTHYDVILKQDVTVKCQRRLHPHPNKRSPVITKLGANYGSSPHPLPHSVGD